MNWEHKYDALASMIEGYRHERDEALERVRLLEAEVERVNARGDATRRELAETRIDMRDAQRERDEARADAASSLAMAKIADAKHDQKCAEVDMLRGIGCMEDGDGPCGACRKCAYRRGAEAMREACAMLVLTSNAVHGRVDADALRDLPIPEDKP